MKTLLQFFIVSLLCSLPALAQTITPYLEPIQASITSGQSGVPYNVTLTTGNSVHFKAEEEILITSAGAPGAEVFITRGTTTGNEVFHAYLVPPVAYAELKPALDGSLYGSIDNRLYFRYEEKYNKDVLLNYKVYNYQRTDITSSLTLTYNNQPVSAAQSLVLGTNYLSLNLSAVAVTNETDSVFILEVSDSKGLKSYLRFKLIKIN